MSYIFCGSEKISLPKKADRAVVSEIASNYLFDAMPNFLWLLFKNVS